jgi:hypothetical protein
MTARLVGWLVVLLVVGACTKAGDEQPTALCERYAQAAERVILDWYTVTGASPMIAQEKGAGHVPAVGGREASFFFATLPVPPSFFAPTVEARCSWRELNLVLEFRSIAEYYDPEITLGSILEDLRDQEGLDAHADRMKIVVEDFDTGFYVAFDPGD